jgi:hypothetical protein
MTFTHTFAINAKQKSPLKKETIENPPSEDAANWRENSRGDKTTFWREPVF